MSPIPVFDHVARIASACGEPIGELEGGISCKDLEEIRSLSTSSPPWVVQRTLAVTHLILNASRVSERPAARLDWNAVQKTLQDADLNTRLLEYDVSQLRAVPNLCTYILSEYFQPKPTTPPSQARRSSSKTNALSSRRSSAQFHEPLSYARVQRASKAAGALFRWCAEVLHAAVETPTVAEVAATTLENTEPSDRVDEAQERPCVSQPSALSVRDQPTETHGTYRSPPRVEKALVTPAMRDSMFCGDRYFEVMVPFPDGVNYVGAQQVKQLRLLAETMKMRPCLELHVAECSITCGSDPTLAERAYSTKLFFDAQGVPTVLTDPEEPDRDGLEGVLCTIRIDRDAELLDFLRRGPRFTTVDTSVHDGDRNADTDTLAIARHLIQNFRMR